MRVLIQGAGPAGLTLALALKAHGIEAVVVDRAVQGCGDGYVVGLRHNGLRAMRELGLEDQILAHRLPLTEAQYRRANGKDFVRYDYSKMLAAAPGGMIAILRTTIMTVLEAACADFDLRYETSIEDLKQDEAGVDVTLSDGTQERVDLVVGADGHRSALRRKLFDASGSCVKELGYRVAAWRFQPKDQSACSVSGVTEPGSQATVYALPDGSAETLLVWRSTDTSRHDARTRKEAIDKLYGEFPDPIQSAIAACPDWASSFADTLAVVDLPQWHQDRVVLLGDAAWSMALITGEGPSTAMAGALVLAEELATGDLPQALSQYEQRLRPTVKKMQKSAAKIGGQFVPSSAFAMWLQKLIMPWMMTEKRLPRQVERMQAPTINWRSRG